MDLDSNKVRNAIMLTAVLVSCGSMFISWNNARRQNALETNFHAFEHRPKLEFIILPSIAEADMEHVRWRPFVDNEIVEFNLLVTCSTTLRNEGDSHVRLIGLLLTNANRDIQQLRTGLLSGEDIASGGISPPVGVPPYYVELSPGDSLSVSALTPVQVNGEPQPHILHFLVFFVNELGDFYDIAARIELLDNGVFHAARDWAIKYGMLPGSSAVTQFGWVSLQQGGTFRHYYHPSAAERVYQGIRSESSAF